MQITYQIIGKDGQLIGKPYKSKQRARNRCDSLDNQYGAYVHFIRTTAIDENGRVFKGGS